MRDRCAMVAVPEESAIFRVSQRMAKPAAGQVAASKSLICGNKYDGAAPESNRPSREFHDRTGFEDETHGARKELRPCGVDPVSLTS